MAVPKRKKSKSRRDMRRAHWKRAGKPPSLSKCPRCGQPKLPHRVCIHCGYYRDQEVVKMDEA